MRQNTCRIGQINIRLNFEDYFFFENAINCYKNETLAFEGETIKHKNKYDVDVYRFAHKISRIADLEMFKSREIGFSYEYNKDKETLMITNADDGIDISFTNLLIKSLLLHVNSDELVPVHFIDIKNIISAIYFVNKDAIKVVSTRDMMAYGKDYLKNQKHFWRKVL